MCSPRSRSSHTYVHIYTHIFLTGPHENNTGVGFMRARLIEIATGSAITFVSVVLLLWHKGFMYSMGENDDEDDEDDSDNKTSGGKGGLLTKLMMSCSRCCVVPCGDHQVFFHVDRWVFVHVCVCMYVCVYVLYIYIYIYTRKHVYILCIYNIIHVSMLQLFIYIYIYIYIYTHMRTHIHTYAYESAGG
jgi:hypothetical protein